MTRREVLTSIICAYIQTNHGLPKLDSKGNLNDSWIHLADAICNATPEQPKDVTEVPKFSDDSPYDEIEKYAY